MGRGPISRPDRTAGENEANANTSSQLQCVLLSLAEQICSARDLINELLSVKEEGEKHPLPIFFSNTVLKRASHALEIPTKFRLSFESLRKHKLSVYCHPTFPF